MLSYWSTYRQRSLMRWGRLESDRALALKFGAAYCSVDTRSPPLARVFFGTRRLASSRQS